MECFLLAWSQSGVGAGIGVGIFRPESELEAESLKIRRLLSPAPRFCLSHKLIQIGFRETHLSRKPKKGHTKSKRKVKCSKKVIWYRKSITSLKHELIWIKVRKSFLSRELIWIKILEDFWVLSRFESNFRNPLWVVSWFEPSLVKPCVMSWFESKPSEIELSVIKNESYWCLVLWNEKKMVLWTWS